MNQGNEKEILKQLSDSYLYKDILMWERIGKWVNSLERSAYAAIENEYHCMEVFESTKTEKVMQKRKDVYFEAKTDADKAIMLYNVLSTYLVFPIIEKIKAFSDPLSNGLSKSYISIRVPAKISIFPR
jgi:hypothetical protein